MTRDWLRSTTVCLALCGTVFLCATLARAEPNDSLRSLRGLIGRPHSEYWLGVYCTQPSPTLRAHLGLEKRQGLVVRDVLDNGPASEAGIHEHDVILNFGKTGVGNVSELVRAIDKRREKETDIRLIRHGSEMTIAVTPSERPRESGLEFDIDYDGNPDLDMDADEILRWIDEMSPREGAPFHFRFFYPEARIGKEPPKLDLRLPDNLKFVITTDEDRFAKIIVEKGGQRWEASTDDLDDLPNAILPFVERLLGRDTPPEQLIPEEPEFPEIEFEADTDTSTEEPINTSIADRQWKWEKELNALENQMREILGSFRELRESNPVGD